MPDVPTLITYVQVTVSPSTSLLISVLPMSAPYSFTMDISFTPLFVVIFTSNGVFALNTLPCVATDTTSGAISSAKLSLTPKLAFALVSKKPSPLSAYTDIVLSPLVHMLICTVHVIVSVA